jgi:serine protease Do
MNEPFIIEIIERYLRNEMNAEERSQFEKDRQTNAELDQMVVEHSFFLQQSEGLSKRKHFKSLLNSIHTDLAKKGQIHETERHGQSKIVYLWQRYKRVTAIAASIAVITTLTASIVISSLAPTVPKQQIQQLNRKINKLENKSLQQDREINNVKSKIDVPVAYTTGGTSFLIDGKGLLVTNAHVVEDANNIAVSSKGNDYIAKVVYKDNIRDLAFLQIVDVNFKPVNNIPYSISQSATDLAESIFTLGYPRNEIVYGQGYLSAKTGFNGDTLSCQIELAANRGNSGSPILNKHGDVIGVLNGRQTDAEGFTFAIHSKYILEAINDLKKSDSLFHKIKLPVHSAIKGMDRVQQVKRVEECVFMVKVN